MHKRTQPNCPWLNECAAPWQVHDPGRAVWRSAPDPEPVRHSHSIAAPLSFTATLSRLHCLSLPLSFTSSPLWLYCICSCPPTALAAKDSAFTLRLPPFPCPQVLAPAALQAPRHRQPGPALRRSGPGPDPGSIALQLQLHPARLLLTAAVAALCVCVCVCWCVGGGMQAYADPTPADQIWHRDGPSLFEGWCHAARPLAFP